VPARQFPYQAAQWKNCEPVVVRGVHAQGLIGAGTEPGEDEDRLRKVCPHAGFPLVGLYWWYVEDTEAAGGLSTLSAFLPASWSVGSWAKKRCVSEAVVTHKTVTRGRVLRRGLPRCVVGTYQLGGYSPGSNVEHLVLNVSQVRRHIDHIINGLLA
jgi:hypothetical protein